MKLFESVLQKYRNAIFLVAVHKVRLIFLLIVALAVLFLTKIRKKFKKKLYKYYFNVEIFHNFVNLAFESLVLNLKGYVITVSFFCVCLGL